MKDKPKSSSSETCGNSIAAQKASLHSIPQSTGGHKDSKVTPIGSKAMTGAKYQ
jgi:hypothetical protein